MWLTVGSEPLTEKYENMEELLQLYSKGFFSFQLQKPVENTSLFSPDYCLILSSMRNYAECVSWNSHCSLPFGTYHLIRQMGKNTQVWFPITFINNKLDCHFWRMSPWQEDTVCGVCYCTVQWVRTMSALSCYQDSSAACNTTASGLHKIWPFNSSWDLLVLGLCYS